MYNTGGMVAGGGVVGGGLAATGASVLWIILATFAFLAVGAALMRMRPKRDKGNK